MENVPYLIRKFIKSFFIVPLTGRTLKFFYELQAIQEETLG